MALGPGNPVRIAGPAASHLVAAAAKLEGRDFALIGGIAVTIRLIGDHRATNDLDSVFNNTSPLSTTAILVAEGVALDDASPQRVIIDGAKVDVIDTQPLPDAADQLPDDAQQRLFVCAHRWAYESAQPVRVVGAGADTTVRVAIPAALVACKSHALRHARSERRALKRTSDLYDTYRLARAHHPAIVEQLAFAPWALRHQVSVALHEDIEDLEQALATVRGSPDPALSATSPDDFLDVMGDLLGALGQD